MNNNYPEHGLYFVGEVMSVASERRMKTRLNVGVFDGPLRLPFPLLHAAKDLVMRTSEHEKCPRRVARLPEPQDYGRPKSPSLVTRRCGIKNDTIAAMVTRRLMDRIGFRRKPLLAIIGIAMITVNAAPLRAQVTADETPPSFEVASIKPDNSGWGGMSSTHDLAPHYSLTNIPLKVLITIAYEMQDFRVSGGPDWINRKRYDIEADIDESLLQQLRKLPENEQHHQLDLMLQSLLAERFKLKVTHTTKQLPAYNLIVLSESSKLQRLGVDPFPSNSTGLAIMSTGRDGQVTIELVKAHLKLLAGGLTTKLAEPVIDQTGVTGNYSFKLRWTDEARLPVGVVPDPAFDRTLTAALQEQLGLKLEPTKAAQDTITIDHIEGPSPN